MTDKTDHPFQSGVRVAIREPWGRDYFRYQERFVEKVYKTGRFTLKGSDQQWRPSEQSAWLGEPKHWIADMTGARRYDRSRLFLWDDRTDAEIRANNDRMARNERFNVIQDRIARMKFNDDIAPDMLDKLEAALPNEASKS